MTDNSPLTCGPDRHITLTYSVALEDGQPIASIDEPATFTWGDESLLLGFQKALKGLKKGDRRSMFVLAADAFGDTNPDNVQYFKPPQLAEMEIEPEVGMMINFDDDHRLNMGHPPVAGVVMSITDEWITVDFNHPLAGKNLLFNFEIFDVQIAPPKVEPTIKEKLGEMQLVNPDDEETLRKEGW